MIPASNPPDPALRVARLGQERAAAEVRLLAAICPLQSRGLLEAVRNGIGPEHFTQADTFAIFIGLIAAETLGRSADPIATMRLCRQSLIMAQCWDDDNHLTYVQGIHWGCGGLSALFTRIIPSTARSILPALAADLLAIDRRQKSLADSLVD